MRYCLINFPCQLALLVGLAVFICASTGCQSVKQKLDYWKQNGHRVGPNYATPAGPLAESYTQIETGIVSTASVDHSNWWQVFNDPELNLLIENLRDQNLSLKAAFYRIEEARHQRSIVAANLFPQSQQATAAYSHTQISRNSGSSFPGTPLTIDDWSTQL